MTDEATRTRVVRKRARRRRLMQWGRRGVYAAVALALIVGAVRAMLPRPVPVETAVVVRGPLEVSVDEDGRTRVVDRYVLSTPLAGTIPRLALREGDEVAEGALIVRLAPAASPLLDPRSRAEAEARLAATQAGQRRAAAEVSRASTAVEEAEAHAQLQRRLADQGAVTRVAADNADFALRARTAELRSAEFGAKVAAQEVISVRAALGVVQRTASDEPGLELRAPASGQVLRVIRRDEGLVAAGTPLLELGDPATLEVVVDVLTRDAVLIEPGDPVRIHDWGGEPLRARVLRIEPSAFTRQSALGVEEQRVNVVIGLDEARAAWRTLADGYRIEASIIVWRGDDVLNVPASAVFRHGDGWAVFRIAGDRATITAVDLGRRNSRQVEVERGVTAGDVVVLHPSDRLSDGADVAPRAR